MARAFAARPSRASRIQTGICVRREYTDRNGVRKICSKAASRERQSPIGALVCGECGQRLVPVAESRGLNYWWILAGVPAVLLLAAGGFYGPSLYCPYVGWGCAAAAPPPPLPAKCSVDEKLINKVAGMKPAEIGALANQCLSQGDYNNAIPLFFAAAQRGDVKAMTTIARLYDPATFQLNKPFSQPNPRQAAEWYKKAADGGGQVQVPRETLKLWLENKKDEESQRILRDYWK